MFASIAWYLLQFVLTVIFAVGVLAVVAVARRRTKVDVRLAIAEAMLDYARERNWPPLRADWVASVVRKVRGVAWAESAAELRKLLGVVPAVDDGSIVMAFDPLVVRDISEDERKLETCEFHPLAVMGGEGIVPGDSKSGGVQ